MTEQEKATEKQVKFATTLGIEKPEVFTKQALREIIKAKLEERDDANGKPEIEVVKPLEKPKKPKVSSNGTQHHGFHLSPEQVRSNALMAIAALNPESITCKEFIKRAAIIEGYLWDGYVENGN